MAVASYVLGLGTSLPLSIELSSKYSTRTSSLLPRVFSLGALLVGGFAGAFFGGGAFFSGGAFFGGGFAGAFFAVGLLLEALVVIGGSTTLAFFFETPIERRVATLGPLVSSDGDIGGGVSIAPV